MKLKKLTSKESFILLSLLRKANDDQFEAIKKTISRMAQFRKARANGQPIPRWEA